MTAKWPRAPFIFVEAVRRLWQKVQPVFAGMVVMPKLLRSGTVRAFNRIKDVPGSEPPALRAWQALQPPLPAPSTESQ